MKCVFLALLFSIVATAQVVPDQYIVELTTEPVARLAARKHKRISRADADLNRHREAIREQQQRLRQGMQSHGAEVLDAIDTVHNAMVVRASGDRLAQLRQMPGVKSVRPVRLYHPTLDYSLPLQNVTAAWNQMGGSEKAGVGIKIGIIDTGIAVDHPAFQDPTLKIPEGFPKVNQDSDLEFTNNKVIVARAYINPSTRRPYPANDAQGHGTGVAMVAAGVTNKGPLATITGVAPKAWLGNYKVFPNDTGGAPTSLILRALEDAVNDGMDVINLSLGSFPASRPSEDSLVIAVENAVAAGRVVVISAGNTGSGMNTIASPAVAPSAITVGSSANGRIFAGKVSTDGGEVPAIPGSGGSPARPIVAPLKDVDEFDPTGLACSGLPANSMAGSIAIISRGTCTFSAKLAAAEAAGAVAAVIYARPEAPAAPNMDVDGAALPAVAISNSDSHKLRYFARNGLTGTIDFSIGPVTVESALLSSFSARGPSSDYGVKPDLLAIGQTVYTARPPRNGTAEYDVLNGTSFSAPTVTGAVALLMSARPGLTAEQYRSLLVNGSKVFSVDGTSALAFDLGGAGLLDMTNAVAGTVTASPVSLSYGKGYPNVDDWRIFKITNVGSTPDTFSIGPETAGQGPLPILVHNTFELAPGQSADVPVKFAGTGLEPGVYEGTLRISGTTSQVAARVPYWFGIPSQKPAAVQVFDTPETARRDEEIRLQFRVLDAAGLPVFDGVNAGIVSTSAGQVLGADYTDYDVPGSWTVKLKTPGAATTMTVSFKIGDVFREIAIRVN
jgi:minor extracellular serine protease Vpr